MGGAVHQRLAYDRDRERIEGVARAPVRRRHHLPRQAAAAQRVEHAGVDLRARVGLVGELLDLGGAGASSPLELAVLRAQVEQLPFVHGLFSFRPSPQVPPGSGERDAGQ